VPDVCVTLSIMLYLLQVFNHVGQRLKTLHDVKADEALYLVPPDRLFVWPTVKVGRKVMHSFRNQKSYLMFAYLIAAIDHSVDVAVCISKQCTSQKLVNVQLSHTLATCYFKHRKILT
jgi:hypothetical protein